jgi:hypothetical protein
LEHPEFDIAADVDGNAGPSFFVGEHNVLRVQAYETGGNAWAASATLSVDGSLYSSIESDNSNAWFEIADGVLTADGISSVIDIRAVRSVRVRIDGAGDPGDNLRVQLYTERLPTTT